MLANDGAIAYSVDIDDVCRFKGGGLRKCTGDNFPEACERLMRGKKCMLLRQCHASSC